MSSMMSTEHQIDKLMRAEQNMSRARTRRDVRYVPKFVETALVLDKAMVSKTQYIQLNTFEIYRLSKKMVH